MGWNSGTEIFDAVCKEILDKDKIEPKKVIKSLIDALECCDWDTESESEYFNHPLVQKIFKKKYPHWFKQE